MVPRSQRKRNFKQREKSAVLRRVDRLVVGWRDMRKKIMAKSGALESRNRGHKAELIEVNLCRTLYRNYIEIPGKKQFNSQKYPVYTLPRTPFCTF